MTHLPTRLTPALALSLTLCAGPAWPGTAEVNFLQPERFADAGRGRDAEQVQATLAQHLQALAARHLPASQTLTVDFTDIDLAGNLRPASRMGQEVRVLRGGADWPRLALHYALSDKGQVIASGDENLADMAYLQHATALRTQTALPYETRLLSAWFEQRFAGRR